VQQQHRHALCRAASRIAHTDTFDLDELIRRCRGVLFALVRFRHHVTGDEGVDLRIAYRRIGQHAEQRLYRQGFAIVRGLAAQGAGVGRFHRVGDLVRLDVEDRRADFDRRAFLDEPRHDRAFFHRQAPLRHDDGRDTCHH
jgi:hypothetical protein